MNTEHVSLDTLSSAHLPVTHSDLPSVSENVEPDTDTGVTIIKVDEETYVFNCYCCRCLKNDEVSTAKRDLYGIIFDWIVDATVGTYHILTGNLIAGVLTYFIVFYAGVIITFTNFSPKKSRCQPEKIKREVWKMSNFYGCLMYIPSFFPICSAKLRLSVAKRLKKSTDALEREDLIRKMEIIKDKALWDSCCESYLEAFPQAVLQIVMILLPSRTYRNFFDHLPIISIFIALNGITSAPISVIEVRHKDVGSFTFLQKLTAYAGNSLRVFSCGLFILSVLSFTRMIKDDTILDIVWISVSALTVFFLLGGPHIINYELEKFFPQYSKIFLAVLNCISFLVCLVSFYLWVISQLIPFSSKLVTFRTVMVIASYSILVFLTCVGILFYREKLEKYNSIASEVLIQVYDGLKGWFKIAFRKCFCK